MTWTPEQRRRYAPVIHAMVRTNATARLVAIIDTIDSAGPFGRPRLWSTIAMLQALCRLCRARAAWKLLPTFHSPRARSSSSGLKLWADLALPSTARRLPRPMIRCGIDLELVGRKNKTGCAVKPKRWRVEQTFGVLRRYHRLLVDHEGSTVMSRTMTLLAALFMTANRFKREAMA